MSYAQEFTVLYSQEIFPPPPPPSPPSAEDNILKSKPQSSSDGISSISNAVVVYNRLNVKDNISYFFSIKADTCRYNEKEWYKGFLHYVDRSKRQTFQFYYPSSFKKATTYPLIDPTDWEIGSKYYVIKGYNTLRATGMMDCKKVDIYFCPDFPTVFGPSLYSGLPGLVIRVDTPRGRMELVNVHEMDLGPFPDVDFNQLDILDNNPFEIEKRKALLRAIYSDSNSKTEEKKVDRDFDQVFECVEP